MAEQFYFMGTISGSIHSPGCTMKTGFNRNRSGCHKIRIKHKVAFIIFTSFIFQSSPAREIANLEIGERGMSRDEAVAEDCKKFRPTISQLKRFFSKAYPVESYVLTHERYSPCYARGTLKFNDGSSGTWKLSSSGVATFVFTRGDVVIFLYKPNSWNDPFSGTYGLGDEGED